MEPALARVLVALLLLTLSFGCQADDGLWKLLRGGGQVLLIRHASTTPGVGDPEGFKLEDCATQRNLSEQGRAEARRLGEAVRRNRIPIERVASSPWCRCLDTAQLA